MSYRLTFGSEFDDFIELNLQIKFGKTEKNEQN